LHVETAPTETAVNTATGAEEEWEEGDSAGRVVLAEYAMPTAATGIATAVTSAASVTTASQVLVVKVR